MVNKKVWEVCHSLAHAEAEVDFHMALMQTAHANRDDKRFAKKLCIDGWLKRVPTLATVVANYKKCEEFINDALDVINEDIVRYLQMLVDDIKNLTLSSP